MPHPLSYCPFFTKRSCSWPGWRYWLDCCRPCACGQNSGVAVITFSREPHSGTQDLARLLAERLGYRYVGVDELSQAVTDRGGVERAPQTSENEGRALSLWEQLGEHLTGDREAYTTALRAVITDLAAA